MFVSVSLTLLLFDLMQRTKYGWIFSSRSMRATREVWNWALTVLVDPLLEEEEEEEEAKDWSLDAAGGLGSAF